MAGRMASRLVALMIASIVILELVVKRHLKVLLENKDCRAGVHQCVDPQTFNSPFLRKSTIQPEGVDPTEAITAIDPNWLRCLWP